MAHNNKLLYLRDFTFDADDIDDERNIEIEDDRRFVRIKLKDYFDIVKKDQGITVKKYANIDEEYEEIMQKSRKKGLSHSLAKSYNRKVEDQREGKSRAVSFVAETIGDPKGKVVRKKKSSKAKPISAHHTSAIRAEEQLKK